MSGRRYGVVLGEFDKWLFDHRGASANTRRQYVARVLHAERWTTQEEGVSLVWADLHVLKKYLFSLKPTARSRNHSRQALVAFWSFLVDAGYAQENLADQLPRLPEKRAIPKALTLEQASALRTAAVMEPGPAGIAVLILLYTGIRNAEIRSLTWDHLDLSGGWVRFFGKGGKERSVPLHPELVEALTDWKRRCNERYILPSPRGVGEPVSESHLTRMVRQMGDRVHIKGLSPHVLRHTAATVLLESGANLREVQELLGHSNVQTTAVYTKVRSSKLEEAIRKVDYHRRGGHE